MVSAEALRRAFLATTAPPRFTGASSHGTFGSADEWKSVYREEISLWLAESAELDDMVMTFCRYTAFDGEFDQILSFCAVIW